MERTYRIGTRTSPLALKQVEEALVMLRRFYPGMRSKVIGIDTYGDKDKATPISEIEGTDFFTREIDEALLKDEIDFAVHSAKDLPDELRAGLVISALTECLDPYDALVSKSGLTLDKLQEGARIGTSSLRRKAQLKEYRRDFEIVDVRGNIEERLMLLNKQRTTNDDQRKSRAVRQAHGASNGAERSRSTKSRDERRNMDAIVIAACALTRLGLSHRITQRIPLEILRPHPLQGSLAIVAKESNRELLELLSTIDSRKEVLS